MGAGDGADGRAGSRPHGEGGIPSEELGLTLGLRAVTSPAEVNQLFDTRDQLASPLAPVDVVIDVSRAMPSPRGLGVNTCGEPARDAPRLHGLTRRPRAPPARLATGNGVTAPVAGDEGRDTPTRRHRVRVTVPPPCDGGGREGARVLRRAVADRPRGTPPRDLAP